MAIFRPRESGATPDLGSCGSGYGGYLGGIHLPTGRAHQEGSTHPNTAPPGAMWVGVGAFLGVFTCRYVGYIGGVYGPRGVYGPPQDTSVGLWTVFRAHMNPQGQYVDA